MTQFTLGLFVALLTTPAWAVEAAPAYKRGSDSTPAPLVQSQAFEAWTLECLEGRQPVSCRISTSIAVQTPTGERAVAAAIGLIRVPATDRVQISIQLPVGVMLQPGVALSGPDGGMILKAPFIVCTSQACEAGAVLETQQLQALLAAGERASAQYVLAGDQQVRLDFSMKGFSSAVAAMAAR